MYLDMGVNNHLLFGLFVVSVFLAIVNHLLLTAPQTGRLEIVVPLFDCVSIANAVDTPVIGFAEADFVSSTSLLLPDMKIGYF
jgi:hypothetical protein